MSPLRLRHLTLAAAIVAVGACYEDPQQKLDQMQQLLDIGDALNELALRTADLQMSIDSLAAIVAKQDTAIYRMANVTGLSYRLR